MARTEAIGVLLYFVYAMFLSSSILCLPQLLQLYVQV